MELDEFKKHWNLIQDNDGQEQKISTQRLNQIIMNTTETVNHLHAKSIYWQKIGKPIITVLSGVLIVFFLITIIKAVYTHSKLSSVLESVIYFAVLVVYCLVTVWVYKRQVQIFTLNSTANVRDSIARTIETFKRFYITVNIIYFFLYPAYFYAVIKLLIPYWHPTRQTTFIIIAFFSFLALVCGHWYYRARFFKKLNSLEANLADLNKDSLAD